MTALQDPSRHLVGGHPQSVVISARVARFLDGAAVDRIRREFVGLDQETYLELVAIHVAGLQYATAAAGRAPLPPPELEPVSRYDLLTTNDVADRIGCKARNVRDLHDRGRLVGDKVGGRLLFAPELVDGYLADRESA